MQQEMQLRALRRAGSPARQPDLIRGPRHIGRHRLAIVLMRSNEHAMRSDAGMGRSRVPVRPSAVYTGIRARGGRSMQRNTAQRERIDQRNVVIDLLIQAVEVKDGYTAAHLQRLESYASAVGARLGMRGPQLAALCCGALLHDIGKLGGVGEAGKRITEDRP